MIVPRERRASRRSLLTALVLCATACTASPPVASSGAPAATTAATAATSAAPTSALKIGILIPFTESALDSDIGASQRRAADLYVKLHGGMLGGRSVQLVYNDESALDPATNEVRVKQFLDQDKVELLMGGANAPAAYLLRATAEASKLVYVDTNATANALTRDVAGCRPACKSRYVFRTSSTSWQLSEPLGEWASKNGQKEFFEVYADDTFGGESAAAFSEGLAKNAGKATGTLAIPPKSGDWPRVIATLKAQPTKNVFAAFITDDAEGFLTQWEKAGMGAGGYRLYGPGPLVDAEVLNATKQAAIGATSSFYWSTELDNAENRSLGEEFRKAYRDDETGQPLAPDGYAVAMWDAIRALDLALAATKGDPRPDALVPALEAVSFRSQRGEFAFDRGTHGVVMDIYIREARASGGHLVNAIVDKIGRVADPGR